MHLIAAKDTRQFQRYVDKHNLSPVNSKQVISHLHTRGYNTDQVMTLLPFFHENSEVRLAVSQWQMRQGKCEYSDEL